MNSTIVYIKKQDGSIIASYDGKSVTNDFLYKMMRRGFCVVRESFNSIKNSGLTLRFDKED
jgi:hypothetical protein